MRAVTSMVGRWQGSSGGLRVSDIVQHDEGFQKVGSWRVGEAGYCARHQRGLIMTGQGWIRVDGECLMLYGVVKEGRCTDVRDPVYVVFANSFDCAISLPRLRKRCASA